MFNLCDCMFTGYAVLSLCCPMAQEKVSILLGQIDELKKNIPKKVARRMEREAERAQEQELGGEGSRGGSNCCGIKCVIC